MKKRFRQCTQMLLIIAILLTQVLIFAPVTQAADTANLASGKTITASSTNQSFVATNANDGNVNTYWEGAPNTYPNNVIIDLGSIQPVYKVVVKLNPATAWATRTQTISVATGTDSVNYTTRVAPTAYSFNPASGNTVTITFPEVSARFIKLIFTTNSGAVGGQAAEIEVYGTATSTGTPDLVVTDITWTPASPVTGNEVKFSAVIKNQGTGATPAGTIHGVLFQVNGTSVNWSDNYTSSIPAGSSVTVTATGGPSSKATWTAGANGNYNVLAWVDDINRIANESNESNNQFTNTLTVGGTTTTPTPTATTTPTPAATKTPTPTPTSSTVPTSTPTPTVTPTKTPTPTPTVTPTPTNTTGLAIPGRVEAEAYGSMSGIQTENCSEGTLNIGWVDPGDWMDYVVNVANSGIYTINARVASPNTGTSFKLQKNGTDLAAVAVPNTGSWQTWTTVSANVNLSSGVQTLRIYCVTSGFNLNYIDYANGGTPTPTPTQTPTPTPTIPAGQPDLVVTDVTWSPVSPAVGSEVTFSAVVKNQGTGVKTAGIINGVAFQINGSTVNWSDTNTSAINPGASVTLTANYGPSNKATWTCGSGMYTLTAWVDDVNRIAESNESNNQFSKTFPNVLVTPTPTPTPSPAVTPTPTPTPPPGSGDVIGKVYAGYQGWFTCYGDGSPIARWFHWSDNGAYQSNSGVPAPGNVKFEVYPDVREYTTLYSTNLGNLNNGQPAKLFSSYDAQTINKHFEWMQTYGIDGAALQRFGCELTDSVFKAHRDSVTTKVNTAAQTYGRKFYIMYDTSNMNASTFVSTIQSDWTNTIVGSMNLTNSSAYAKQNGKPVVCIWGLGFTDRPGDASQSLSLVNWFKSQGCYVIGGVPTQWRNSTDDSKPGFQEVYKAFNMISPWSVGRFGDQNGADNFKNNQLVPDLALCNANGQTYQPVMFPGFAWSNWNGGARNMIPRAHGDFMWRQAYNMKSIGLNTAYIAMFDEYDEGTAIAKAAENSSMIPNNQYFLTLDADGVACSSDFYLRLSGDITRMLKGQISMTAAHPTAHQTQTGNGTLSDSNIKYFGRWDFSNTSQYGSYWGGAYIKTNFTGTTVKIKLGNTSNYYAKIDNGPWVSYNNVSGTVNLTPTPLAQGTHTLSVAEGKDYGYEFQFQGLVLDSGAVTTSPVVQSNLIEFIGDSITAGYTDSQANVSDYAWIASEQLNCEHTQIAFPGIALATGYGVNPDKTGMDTQYFKLKPLGYTNPPDWDFSKYTPKIVVINLGTNDQNSGTPDSTFQSKYITLLADVRAKFPNAEIFAMRCFGGHKAAPTQAAVNARIAAGDNKVHFIDTTGWLVSSDYNDGTHPSDSGQAKAANLLTPILSPYLN